MDKKGRDTEIGWRSEETRGDTVWHGEAAVEWAWASHICEW